MPTKFTFKLLDKEAGTYEVRLNRVKVGTVRVSNNPIDIGSKHPTYYYTYFNGRRVDADSLRKLKQALEHIAQ